MQAILFLTYFEFQSTFMDKDTALKDLKEITTIIDRSKRYTSISGLSIVLAGLIALFGIFMANGILKGEFGNFNRSESELLCLYIFSGVLLLSLIVIIILSAVKSLKHGEKIWNEKAQKCFIAFCYPIITGGVLSLWGYIHSLSNYVPSIQLIFYGLACIAGSPHSFKEFRVLGLATLILGIISLEYISFNLILWAVGFGVCNIIYGLYIHFKYEK